MALFSGAMSFLPDNDYLMKLAFLGVVVYAVRSWWQLNVAPNNANKSTWPPIPTVSPSQVHEFDELAAPQDPEAQKAAMEAVMSKAAQYQNIMGDEALTTEHLVLALAQDPRFGEILSCSEGLAEKDIKEAIRKSRLLYDRGNANFETEDGPLKKYTYDLTAAARNKKLDPVVGRHDEIRRCINILSRRTKNNPVVLGEAGVGKTAVVEALAQRLVSGDVPTALKGVTMLSLDMGAIIAGAVYPGEFEERMRGLLAELTQAPGSYILFIDDLHNVTGPNAQQGGGVNDASILLKPLLGRGELRVIGCTSLDKYRKFIEKDPALERRFQQVAITEPTPQQTVSILRGLRRTYEAHHDVRITDAALVAAATLSARYITDRCLPDKAIDLVDEATAKVRMDSALRPEHLDRLERRAAQLRRERRVLLRTARRDRNDAAQLEGLDAELADVEAQAAVAREALAAVEAGRPAVAFAETPEIKKLQEEIEKVNKKIEAAARGGNGEREAELKARRRAFLKDKLRLTRRAEVTGTSGRPTVTGVQ